MHDICSWVKEGRQRPVCTDATKETYVSMIEQKLGIISSGYQNAEVSSIYFEKDFLIGGAGPI